MQHANDLIEEAKDQHIEQVATESLADIEFEAIDRNLPRWALSVALAYGFVNFAIFLAIAVAPVFLFSLVAIDGQVGFAALVVIALIIPLSGTLLIDFAYRWSLTGLKDVRVALAAKAAGGIGVLGAAILMFIQPYFLIPIGLSTILGVVGLQILKRFDRDDKAWDFKREEAVSILSGRDDIGFELASARSAEHTLASSVHRFGTALSGLIGFALASWLVARNVLTPESVASLAFISMLITDMILRAARAFVFASESQQNRDTIVRALSDEDDDESEIHRHIDHFSIKGLSVVKPNGDVLLGKISFDVLTGSIVQITGASGDGKSLLLKAISDPFSLSNCEVRGRVTFGGSDLWDRSGTRQAFPAVRVDPCPAILPATAQENLTCFQSDIALDRARNILRKIVYSQDIIERLASDDVPALQLPLMQQKVLGLARAFLLSPQILLLDCPEAFLQEQQVAQILDLLKSQARMGRITFIVTENRSLVEACDKVLVLQAGHAVDFGEGTDIRARHGSGWRRFTGARQLETEEALHSWLCSQFIRNGDEGNRRRVCEIGSNILAHYCLSCSSDDQGEITFECKQKAGSMELRVSDDKEPISTIQFEQAKQQLFGDNLTTQLSPLSKVLRDARNVRTDSRFGQREMSMDIETYDPRKRQQAASKE